jgi:hypothetical protein
VAGFTESLDFPKTTSQYLVPVPPEVALSAITYNGNGGFVNGFTRTMGCPDSGTKNITYYYAENENSSIDGFEGRLGILSSSGLPAGFSLSTESDGRFSELRLGGNPPPDSFTFTVDLASIDGWGNICTWSETYMVTARKLY